MGEVYKVDVSNLQVEKEVLGALEDGEEEELLEFMPKASLTVNG